MTTGIDHPSKLGTIPRLLLAAADVYGDESALEDGDSRWTFRELAQAALESGAAFVAAGLEPGDRVAVWAPNSSGWILAALGVHCAGGALVPLSTRFKGAEAAYVLRKSRARMLVSVEEFLGIRYLDLLEGHDLPQLEKRILLEGSATGAERWAEFLERGRSISRDEARARAEAVAPGDLADIMFTSGTTGDPKGVMIAHEQNLWGYERWTEVIGLRRGDRYLIVNPFFHAFGYKAGWMACIMRGATILPHAVFDVAEVLARVAAERVSVLPGPPTLYQTILAFPERSSFDLSSLRLGVTGASAVAPEMIRRVRTELGFETILSGFGLTESVGLATNSRHYDDAETIALTSGQALPGVEVRCVEADGSDAPLGESGEVWIRGPNVMRGYFDDDEATKEAVDPEGWLHTGDIGTLDERGYLRITDRKKDMFIVGGFNCYPAEIEKLMFEMPEIAEVAVIGVPDERMGEVGRAFVVPVPGTEPTSEAIVAWCREHMANYKVPRIVTLESDLPRTPSGKVQKFVLRETSRSI